MHSQAIPAICLGLTGNFQGSSYFLSLLSGLVIKRRAFDELPAPKSVIDRVVTLAATSGVLSDIVFANRHQVPFPWSTEDSPGIDSTPIAPYPDITAKMLGLLVNCGDCESPASAPAQATPVPQEPDLTQLADNAAQNANLDTTDFLPPPPEVITIDGEDDLPATAILPTTSYLPIIPKVKPDGQSPKVESKGPPPQLSLRPSTPMPSHYPTCSCCAPHHLGEYHLFTMVADELSQSLEHPYWIVGGTAVNLAITDENMIAQICHYVMTHTADTLFCTSDLPSNKKQYRLKAGLNLFADQGNKAVI